MCNRKLLLHKYYHLNSQNSRFVTSMCWFWWLCRLVDIANIASKKKSMNLTTWPFHNEILFISHKLMRSIFRKLIWIGAWLDSLIMNLKTRCDGRRDKLFRKFLDLTQLRRFIFVIWSGQRLTLDYVVNEDVIVVKLASNALWLLFVRWHLSHLFDDVATNFCCKWCDWFRTFLFAAVVINVEFWFVESFCFRICC